MLLLIHVLDGRTISLSIKRCTFQVGLQAAGPKRGTEPVATQANWGNGPGHRVVPFFLPCPNYFVESLEGTLRPHDLIPADRAPLAMDLHRDVGPHRAPSIICPYPISSETRHVRGALFRKVRVVDFLFLLFLSKPLWMWLLFIGLVIGLLAFDLGVLHKDDHEIGVAESLRMSAMYILLALSFSGFIWWQMDATATAQYLTAFVVEKTLALDNIFVIALIFGFLPFPASFSTASCSGVSSA